MTNKTKLSIFVIAGIVALATVATTITLDEQITTQEKPHMEFSVEPSSVEPPNATEPWQGVPMLRANVAFDQDSKALELDTKTYSWLERAVRNGETIVTDRELNEFFAIADGNYNFKVNSEVYKLSFNHANIRLDQHYVKAFPYDEPRLTVKEASFAENTWMQKATNHPYDWIQISESEANSLMNFKLTGSDVRTLNGDVRVQYIGPLSEEVRSVDYKDILAKSTGTFEEQGHE